MNKKIKTLCQPSSWNGAESTKSNDSILLNQGKHQRSTTIIINRTSEQCFQYIWQEMLLFSVLCCHIIIKSNVAIFCFFCLRCTVVKREILMNNKPITINLAHCSSPLKFKDAETRNRALFEKKKRRKKTKTKQNHVYELHTYHNILF